MEKQKFQCCASVICFVFIRDITEGKPLPLEVTGIEYMNDDPAMVDILYAKVNVKDGSDKSVFSRKMGTLFFPSCPFTILLPVSILKAAVDGRPAGRAFCL